MSRDPFRDEETPERGSEPYRQGRASVDSVLLDALIARHQEHTIRGDWFGLEVLGTDIIDRLRAEKNLDPQRLVDGLVKRMEQGSPDAHTIHTIDDLLSPLLSMVYDRSEDYLHVDYSHLSKLSKVGARLTGIRERPITLTYAISNEDKRVEHRVGDGARNARIRVQGNVHSLGSHAQDCSFYLDRLPKFVGRGSTNCAFFIDEECELYPGLRFTGDRESIGTYTTVTGRMFHTYLAVDFFDEGNKILVPDGSGGWEELTR